MSQGIKNRKDMWSRTIPPAFAERGPVNFGPLSTKWVCTHPSGHFSTDYISAFRGCWPLKFLHALQFDDGSLAHTINRVRGLPKNFKGEHLKLGLEFHTWAPITLRVVGVPSRNFTRGRGSRPGWSSGHQFYKGCPLQNLGGQKMSKIRRDIWQLSTLIANISGMDQYIENRKSTWSTTFHPLLDEKICWTLVH